MSLTPRRLPMIAGSLRADGSRATVHPADVRGRFATARHIVYLALIALWAVLPWVNIGGNPAVFLDVQRRCFYLFGGTFNAQDIWLVFFLVTGVGFGLVVLTAIAGRVFCGWACPQTVFLDAVFRRLERWVMGPRETRIRRAARGWSFERSWRTALLHALYLAAAFCIAHIVLSYFTTLRGAWAMVTGAPSAHPEAFLWMVAVTALLYFNFAYFREQFCVIVCPYGRLQSVLLDSDSLVIGYDVARGEPRGKAQDPGRGDCVDCKRCVVVCPTGIDIRHGLQLDCVACTACIDACDEVMVKLGQPRGLVRYDSLNGLAGGARRVIRPRVVLYAALLLVGAGVATAAASRRRGFEANLLRLPGAPYVVEGATLRNAFQIHVVNKTGSAVTFFVEPEAVKDVTFVAPIRELTIPAMGSANVPFFATMPRDAYRGDVPLRIRVHQGGKGSVLTGPFLGSRGP